MKEFIGYYEHYALYKTESGYEAKNTLMMHYLLESNTYEGIISEIDFQVEANKEQYCYAV